jgi:hypothetical protein
VRHALNVLASAATPAPAIPCNAAPPVDREPKRGDLVRYTGRQRGGVAAVRAGEQWLLRREQDSLVVDVTDGKVICTEPDDPLSAWTTTTDRVTVVARATYTTAGDEATG